MATVRPGALGCACAACLTVLGTSFATGTEGPLSAIDWLNDPAPISLTEPLQTALPAVPARADAAGEGARVPEVEVSPLAAQQPDAAGLLSSASTGLPPTLWRESGIDTVAALISRLPPDPLPALQALYYTLLLAEAEAPADTGADARFLHARIDALRKLGAVDPALALLDQAGPAGTMVFDRWFDLSLLAGTEDVACSALADRPDLTRRYDARVFCHARAGDWQTAALTYETALALDVLEPGTENMLAAFLDPELIEDMPPLAPSSTAMTPLIFRLHEAVGTPLPTTNLPREYAVADLRGLSGWKAEIEAAERLTHTGALPANQLLGLYTSQAPAASGGVWERTAGVQALESALEDNDTAAVARILPSLWDGMRREGLAVAFATLFADRLAMMQLDQTTRALAFRIALLSPQYESIAPGLSSTAPRDRFLISLARGAPDATLANSSGEHAVSAGFSTGGRPSSDHADLLDAGRLGQAILLAALQLDAAGPNAVSDIEAGLATLRAVGLEDTARRAALEILLLRAAS
ncbi:MAG: hypothetical protein AAGA28_06310 [Pseudomonadota bacterium]